MLALIRDVAVEVLADNAMPVGTILLIEEFFDMLTDLRLYLVIFYGKLGLSFSVIDHIRAFRHINQQLDVSVLSHQVH